MYEVIEVPEPPERLDAVTWKSPELLPVLVSVNVSVMFAPGAALWLPPFVLVRVGAF